MAVMYENLITALAGTACGGLVGGLVGWRKARRTFERTVPHTGPENAEDDWVQDAAQQWAVAHGRPEAETLIASKLRLGIELHERRGLGRRKP